MDLTRRQFLRLTSLAALATASHRLQRPLPPEDQSPPDLGLGRVIAARVTVRREPSARAERAGYRHLDRVINLWDSAVGDDGPAHNPLWYQVAGGYVHSGWIQPVRYDLQPSPTQYPGGSFLAEVSVPFTDSRLAPEPYSRRGYRLYFGTVHWVTGLRIDALGGAWYRTWDDKWHTSSYVSARHLRPIPEGELTPLSPHVAGKRLEVDLAGQMVRAYEYDQLAFETRTATGAWYEVDGRLEDFTTPIGQFRIIRKMPTRHMAAGDLAAGDGYDLPGVPWVSYFTLSGVAFHGTYWHNDYGRPRSHGCVNLTPEAARWVYRWCLPLVPVGAKAAWEDGAGTAVRVF